MKHKLVLALIVGAIAVVTRAVVIAKKRKDEDRDCYPEFCGFCYNEDCEYGVDMPTVLHGRCGV